MTRNATKKKGTRGSESGSDALALLKADHAAVKKLFKEYDKAASSDGDEATRGELATRICLELTVHARIEEEIFYPALRDALDEQDLLDEAEIEHASAKDLIDQLESMTPDDELYDARVTVLGEYIDHHVQEEEGEMFKEARKAGIDLKELGDQMRARQEELKEELGLGPEDEGEEDREPAPRSRSRKKSGSANGSRRAA